MKGTRVQAIIRELRGEKIDIVEWSDDPILFVTNALSPAKVQRVSIVDDDERVMEVVVEDKQLSLAIGKKGQNVRLAAKLTGWRIDIKSEEEKRREVEAQFGALERAEATRKAWAPKEAAGAGEPQTRRRRAAREQAVARRRPADESRRLRGSGRRADETGGRGGRSRRSRRERQPGAAEQRQVKEKASIWQRFGFTRSRNCSARRARKCSRC